MPSGARIAMVQPGCVSKCSTAATTALSPPPDRRRVRHRRPPAGIRPLRFPDGGGDRRALSHQRLDRRRIQPTGPP